MESNMHWCGIYYLHTLALTWPGETARLVPKGELSGDFLTANFLMSGNVFDFLIGPPMSSSSSLESYKTNIKSTSENLVI